MSDEPLLVDLVLRETFRGRKNNLLMPDDELLKLRRELVETKRVKLDEDMTRFLAEMAYTPFESENGRNPETLDSLRHSARLPHASMWVEYSGRTFIKALKDRGANFIHGKTIDVKPDEAVDRIGWLLSQDEGSPLVRLHYFCRADIGLGARVMAVPCTFMWNIQDETMMSDSPDIIADFNWGMVAHGVTGYVSKQIAVVAGVHDRIRTLESIRMKSGSNVFQIPKVLVELGGIVRYAICFLALLNDVPTSSKEVLPSKGYFAKGNYRKYLEHTVVNINVPQSVSYRKLAERLATLSRRRAHEVRGHWRVYPPKKGGPVCEGGAHLWSEADATGHSECRYCAFRRTWIEKHQRGDASLGFVTHSYKITHKVPGEG